MKYLPTSNGISKVAVFIKAHKAISTMIALAIIGVGWWMHSRSISAANAQTRYVLGSVTRGTIVASVSGSGQVSSTDQINITPKASGEITWVGVDAGNAVYAGQAIAQIDDATARQAIADAESALVQAKLQYQKDSAQAPIDYQNAQAALATAQTNLTTTYSSAYTAVSNVYLDMPTTVTGMQNLLYAYDLSISKNQWNIDVLRNVSSSAADAVSISADKAASDYKIARADYDSALLFYKTFTRSASNEDIEKLLAQSTDMTTAVAQSIQSDLNLLDAVVDYYSRQNLAMNQMINTMRTNARSYLSTANGSLASLLAQKQSLDAAKKSVLDNQHAIQILAIGNSQGDNPISLQASQNNLANQERKLKQLKDDLSNYTIRAQFAGIIASLNVQKFDTVGTGTTVATLITNQKIATLSLNEVDVAKIKLADKATLTFDAIEGLTLTGTVTELDAVGTVSQGVVSYKVNIAFDSQDARIKPGMTVNATVQTQTRQNVLMVPSSAVKNRAGQSSVQLFSPPIIDNGGTQGNLSVNPPQSLTVQAGISDDSNSEIISGVNESDQIVVRTISGTATQSTQSAPSLLNAVGGNRGGGGALRAATGR